MVVNYADLDIHTPLGAEKLYERIQQAAAQLCPQVGLPGAASVCGVPALPQRGSGPCGEQHRQPAAGGRSTPREPTTARIARFERAAGSAANLL